MGNILTQVRHNRAGTKIEDMKYQYLDPTTKTKLQRNRLYHIYEPLSLSSLDATDIDNMGAYDSTALNINSVNNYVYDEEGRLVKDKAEKINKIVWRVDGKVKEIQRMTGSTKWLKFDYDAMGHRIAKHVYNNTGTTLERSTYYILDAQGNTISTYDHEVVAETAQFNLKERNIFGSSRIGSKQDSLNILTATITQNYTQVLGTKYYEFSNHLGNVLTVYSDVKIALDANSDGIVDGFRVPIRNAADYSPFGMQLDGRTITMDSYRRGFNGMEKDDEVKGDGNSYDFGARMYDARVGRWWSLDAMSPKYPSFSPYSFAGNSPISFVDQAGDSIYLVINGVAHNIKSINATSSQEIKDIAYFTLKRTGEGNRILEKYRDSDRTDIYIAIGDVTKDGAMAETNQVVMGSDNSEIIPKGTPLPSNGDLDVFAGVTTKNSGNVFTIVVNEDFINGVNEWARKINDKYERGTVLYHEMRAHIEMSNVINAKVAAEIALIPLPSFDAGQAALEEYNQKVDAVHPRVSHEAYGSYNSGDTRNSVYTDPNGSERWKKPAWTIGKQMEKIRKSDQATPN